MTVKSAIILCAGMGNRMGSYGNFLPKPLWPFFQTSLLGLQINYLKKVGIENIYVNLHHQRDLIKEYLSTDFPEVNLLIEEEILDVGGGVQNFLQQENVKNEEVVLAINSDIFIDISVDEINSAANELTSKEAHSLLFLKEVKKLENEGYTEVLTNSNEEITGLIKSAEVTKETYNTYVGCCLVNNKIIPKISGKSSFFQTIADFKKVKILGYKLGKNFYDLGTLKRYHDTLSRVWSESDDQLLSFIQERELFN